MSYLGENKKSEGRENQVLNDSTDIILDVVGVADIIVDSDSGFIFWDLVGDVFDVLDVF